MLRFSADSKGICFEQQEGGLTGAIEQRSGPKEVTKANKLTLSRIGSVF